MPFTEDVQETIGDALPKISGRLLDTRMQDVADLLDRLDIHWGIKGNGVVVVTVRPRFGSTVVSGRTDLEFSTSA